MRINLLVAISFISIIFLPSVVVGQKLPADNQAVIKLESLSLEARVKLIEDETTKLKDSSYVGLLEKGNAILESTNNALTQRWTPLVTILAALTAIYALITVAWGMVFAFGYKTYKNAQAYEQKVKKQLVIIKKEQEIFALRNSEVAELTSQLKTKKKDVVEIEAELQGIMDKSEQALKKLEKEAYSVAMSSSGTASIVMGSSAFVLGSAPLGYGGSRTETCSRCGTIFADPESQIRGGAYSEIPIVDRAGYLTEEILCPRCKGTIK